MAYDRDETRREREWRGQDRDRGGGNERGFFERAGEEISSWFGGDDDRNHGRHPNERMNRDRGSGWRPEEYGWGGDPNYDRNRGPSDDDRRSSRPMNWTSSNSDYRSGGSSDRGSFGSDRGNFGSQRQSGGDRDYRPMAGDYGRSDDSSGGGGYDRSQSPWGRDDYRRTSSAGSNRSHDRHYDEWRQRQMDEIDRDYEDYRREHQQRFESDFGSWRQNRQQKRGMVDKIREHMDVVGSDGESIGKVDKVRGDRIILTKSNSDDNRHHALSCMMIDTIEGDQVRLDIPAAEAKSRWEEIGDDRGLIGGGNDRDDGDHVNLERSFSGTYR
ncbi:MAG: DUF2171 domain-containing protein [Sphingomonas sp.]|nr:DUF2171 domain-containing protein [Sphingomonas sp.]